MVGLPSLRGEQGSGAQLFVQGRSVATTTEKGLVESDHEATRNGSLAQRLEGLTSAGTEPTASEVPLVHTE